MAPPELAGDAPVLDVGQPVLVGLHPLRWNDLGAPGSDGFQSRLSERLGLDEPLCRDDIGTILNHCHKNRIFTTLVTNGYFVKDRIDDIQKLDYLIISLDGTQQVHDKNRQKDSFNKVMEAIKITETRLPVMTNTVLNKDNIDSIDFILELSKKHNFITHFNVIQGAHSFIPADNYQKAITMFDTLIHLYPNHPAPYFFKAASYQNWMGSFRINYFQEKLEHNINMVIEKAKNKIVGGHGKKRSTSKASKEKAGLSRQGTKKETAIYKEVSGSYYLRCSTTWPS